MGYFVFAALIILAIIYGLIVSRGFRIFAALLFGGAVVALIAQNDNADRQRAADKLAADAATVERGKRREVLWSKVAPSQIALRDVSLSTIQFDEDNLEISGSAKNLSNEPISIMEIEVVLTDCVGTSKCEIVGHGTAEIDIDIPAGEVRAISGKVLLPNIPEPRGVLSPRFTVKRVFAGDFLDSTF